LTAVLISNSCRAGGDTRRLGALDEGVSDGVVPPLGPTPPLAGERVGTIKGDDSLTAQVAAGTTQGVRKHV